MDLPLQRFGCFPEFGAASLHSRYGSGGDAGTGIAFGRNETTTLRSQEDSPNACRQFAAVRGKSELAPIAPTLRVRS